MKKQKEKKVEMIKFKPIKTKHSGFHGGWGGNNIFYKKLTKPEIIAAHKMSIGGYMPY